ncbi:MAG: histidine kinase dimerization/phospho-acceptor domain-containing protein, partial [Phormidesmis sp.]
MLSALSARLFRSRLLQSVSLQRLLTVTAVSQILGTVGLVGYLSFKNGQKAVEELGNQLISSTNSHVEQELEDYLAIPHVINNLNIDAVKSGLLTIKDPKVLEYRLWNQLQAFKTVSYVYISSTQGGSVAVGRDKNSNFLIEQTDAYPNGGNYSIFRADQQGKRLQLMQVIQNQSAPSRPWFKQPVAAKKAVWTQPFSYVNRESITAISASAPLYDLAGKLQGVTTVDIDLDHLSYFLQTLVSSEQEQIFVMDRQGKLLASSEQMPTIAIRDRAKIIQAHSSPNPLVRQTVQALETQFKALANISQYQSAMEINGQSYFVQVNPWKDGVGLDWLVVVMVPQAKFMAQIQINNRITIGLCLLSAAIATLIATLIAHRISAPISRLSAASQTITEASRHNFAGGKLDPMLKTSGIKEFKTLALNFERMNDQLQSSYAQLEDYSHSLEAKVRERTLALEKEIVVRKQAEAQSLKAKEIAEVANQAKSEFLANMSHELRSPLNAILGFAQLMRVSNTLSAEHHDSTSVISRSGEHLLNMINDVLDMSKIEAGYVTYTPVE